MRLVLASASPRRAELLRAAGFTFDTVVVDVDESVRSGEKPADYVRRLAMEKSAAALTVVASGFSRTTDSPPGGGLHIVLGADTAVVVDGEILGKPRDDRDARAMLERLSGRPHDVLTGISLRCTAGELGGVERTAVWFAPLSAEDVAWYLSSGEGRDKAGAYAIQGLASRFVSRIDGSYANVVGLPVAKVAELLRVIGLLGASP
jgi:nucleoside triphosphate pyrophosphatase